MRGKAEMRWRSITGKYMSNPARGKPETSIKDGGQSRIRAGFDCYPTRTMSVTLD